MGELGDGQGYVCEEQYSVVLLRYNRVLEGVAIEHGLHYIDLPELLEPSGNCFYDGMHISELGAAAVAEEIADAFVNEIIPD